MTNKPTMNKISLECIVGAQVLCEFQNPVVVGNSFELGFLVRIGHSQNVELEYFITETCAFDKCRIYPNYWISNHDGKLVLPDGLKVDYITRHNAQIFNCQSQDIKRLTHSIGMFVDTDILEDIIAVRVIGLAPQWEY